ncbi:MAG TPA: hypothetical protein PKY30_23515 [Myxococcota bacterium]|nr:hypothetical protein [Myxococcota bacterium]
MRQLPLGSLLSFSLFLLACTGCCCGPWEETKERAAASGYSQHRADYLQRCTRENADQGQAQAKQGCECVAEWLESTRGPAVFLELLSLPKSEETRRLFSEARTACGNGTPLPLKLPLPEPAPRGGGSFDFG